MLAGHDLITVSLAVNTLINFLSVHLNWGLFTTVWNIYDGVFWDDN